MCNDDIDQLDDVYGRFKSNGGLELRVSRKQYNGSDLVDIRLWLSSGKPTRKGVTLALADVDEVIDSLQAARFSLGRDAPATDARARRTYRHQPLTPANPGMPVHVRTPCPTADGQR